MIDPKIKSLNFWKRIGLSFRQNHQGGFTLVEMLVTIVIFAIFMTGMYGFLWGVTAHWRTGQNVADMTENARLGLNRMTREMMQASQVTSAGANQVSFAVNFGDGWETVTYGFVPGSTGSPGQIWRSSSISPGRSTLVDDVDNVQFSYFGNDFRCDANGDGVITLDEIEACGGDLSKIARVDIQLTMQAGESASQNFTADAWLRNRPA